MYLLKSNDQVNQIKITNNFNKLAKSHLDHFYPFFKEEQRFTLNYRTPYR